MSDHTAVPGATPGDDASGLLQPQLLSRPSRDAAELETISLAYDTHVFRARRKKPGSAWLTDDLLRRVHRDMFGEIWAWAGQYRTVPVNIGVKPHLIVEQIKALFGDFHYWDTEKGSMSLIEMAARLQNRLTRIHPFKNGNGRHARLLTDMVFHSHNHPLPKWPQIQLLKHGDAVRGQYIAAMKKADQDDYRDLMGFIESCLEGKFE